MIKETKRNKTELSGKKLAIIGGYYIKKEINACADKYHFSTVYYGLTKSRIINSLFNRLNLYFPALCKYILKAAGVSGVLLISREKLIDRNIRWISRSDYYYCITEAQWDSLMNKKSFEESASRFGIPKIPGYPVDPSAKDVTCRVDFPVVVKPADGSGSSGVSICGNREELKKALPLAFKNSKCKQVLCQKFLDGPYFQFEIWMQDGKAYFPYTKDRIFYKPVGNRPPQPFIDFYPSVNHELISSSLFNKISDLISFSGIKNGSCMFQGLIDHGVPYIMDTALRISGGLDYKIVDREKGVDLIESHIMYALSRRFGNDFGNLDSSFVHAYATICVGLKNGTIADINGLEKISGKPYVFDCFQYYDVGYRMTQSGLFSQVCFRIFLVDDNREKLVSDIREILGILQINDKNGDSLLLEYPEL